MNRRKKRVEDLAEKIRYHQDLYYNRSPEISDRDFDVLWDELKQLDPSHDLFFRVGVDRDVRYQKRPHILFMHSQEKVAHADEFRKWAQKTQHQQFVVQYKLDGMSLELQYRSGHLRYGISRGDGRVGDDLSHNVRQLFAARLVLPEPFSGAVRGEVIMLRELHREHYADQATVRNTVNGLMKRKDGAGVKHLRLYSYDVQYEDDSKRFENEIQKLEWLKAMGFLIVETKLFANAEEVVAYQKRIMQKRNTLPFEIDGLVIKGPAIDYADLQRPRPEKQVAFKFAPEEAITEIRDLEWSASGHRYTPIALLEAVKLAGTTVQRASLVNPDFIAAEGVAVGAKVVVTKRGDIIPRIERVLSLGPSSYLPMPPFFCDACGTRIRNEGTVVYCPNPSCRKRSLHRVRKWIDTLKIKHLGGKRISLLFEKRLVEKISDLYALSKETLAALDGFGELLAQHILDSLKESKRITFARLLAGFDIAGAGEITTKKIEAEGFRTIDALVSASEEDLAEIEGMGAILSANFLSEFAPLAEEMQQLLDSGAVILTESSPAVAGPLTGSSFCFTGSLERMTRKEAVQRVETAGGVLRSTVTQELSYLVTNDAESTSTKAKKARDLGVDVLDEEAFLALIEEDSAS